MQRALVAGSGICAPAKRIRLRMQQKSVLRTVAVRAAHSADDGEPFELKVVDGRFSAEALKDSAGLITIAGFGSLLSERSARSTFPHLLRFRAARLPGFRRVFAHTCPIFFARGIARPETFEISSLSAEPSPGHSIAISLFEIEATDAAIAAFVEREHEFKLMAVRPFDPAADSPAAVAAAAVPTPAAVASASAAAAVATVAAAAAGAATGSGGGRAVLCTRWSDGEYRSERCRTDEEFEERWGRHGISRIWRDDILPCRAYLRHCVLAATSLGVLDNFLDTTFLGDRVTTIRQHLLSDPTIMEELPPPSLRERYGG